MEPTPLAVPAQRRPSLASRVAAVLWARRWKLVTTIAVILMARMCEYVPDWAVGPCELAAKLAKVLLP